MERTEYEMCKEERRIKRRDKRQNVHAHSELTWSDSWMKSET